VNKQRTSLVVTTISYTVDEVQPNSTWDEGNSLPIYAPASWSPTQVHPFIVTLRAKANEFPEWSPNQISCEMMDRIERASIERRWGGIERVSTVSSSYSVVEILP